MAGYKLYSCKGKEGLWTNRSLASVRKTFGVGYKQVKIKLKR